MRQVRRLTNEELQRKYGRLTILADGGVTVLVRCDCGNEMRKHRRHVLSGITTRCGIRCSANRKRKEPRLTSEQTKQRQRVATAKAHERKREFAAGHLTDAEREQVERIIASRTGAARFDRELRRDAIDVVIRDRAVGEMKCHSGTVETV